MGDLRIAVLGAGAMGSAAATLLARHPDVDLLVLDVDEARARAVAQAAGGAEPRAFDATSGELADLLKTVQSVASCLPFKLNLPAMQAALAAGCHYADLGGLFHTTRKQWELSSRFEAAGVAAVMGIGSAPGLTNVLARAGADRLDSVTSIDLVDGAVEEGGGGFGVPYSAETILDEFTEPAMVFEDGELKEVPAGSGVVEWDFPEPLGTLPAIYTLHSEPATLTETIPGIRDVRWRLALPRVVHEGFALFALVGLASREPIETPSGTAVPREVLVALLNRLPVPEGEPRDIEVLDVRVRGEREGRPATFRGLARFEPSREGLSAGAFGTALPIAITVRWMAAGRVRSGVHPPEDAFEADAFIAECEAEGVGFDLAVREG